MNWSKYNVFMVGIFFLSCNGDPGDKKPVQLITLDPGHFHAALVQKSMYEAVDPTVHVYAPAGADLQQHLNRINKYNNRPDSPTHWEEVVYTGEDFLSRMLEEKKGNVVVLAGNNKQKTKYIKASIDGGFHVLSDKPMAINQQNFELLKAAFSEAAEKDLLLYDIMTERYEITNRLQREFAAVPEIFGSLTAGTADKPGVEMESVHFFYKYVSGSVLVRPAWSLDVLQQGQAITDVATHLVDLVQWECFPEQSIQYERDIEVQGATSWPTEMNFGQFKAITREPGLPGYLKKDVVHDSILSVYSNGTIHYKIKGVHVKVTALWEYEAPEGSGDTHYSILRGSKASLVIRQGAEQNFKPTLYIEPTDSADRNYNAILLQQLKVVQGKYPGIDLKKVNGGWEVVVPTHYKEGHEAHFAQVTKCFLDYLKNGSMPAWEVPNMLSKYYTTTKALELARKATREAAIINEQQ